MFRRWTVDLALDNNKDPRVRVNFNITMCDLKCEFAVSKSFYYTCVFFILCNRHHPVYSLSNLSNSPSPVDVVSVLGTDQNVTSHITKWHMDAQGVRQRFQGRNRQQHDILLKDNAVKESIEDLHADGEDAISLDATTFEFAKNENEYLFVDFCKLRNGTGIGMAIAMKSLHSISISAHTRTKRRILVLSLS
jgi:hypothetical protein